MAGDLTGTLRRTLQGSEYTLRLTFRGFAQLQSEFGDDIGGFMPDEDSSKRGIVSFAVLLRVVEVALQRGMPSLDEARLAEVADDLLTEDPELPAAILTATFPRAAAALQGGAAGNGGRAARRSR